MMMLKALGKASARSAINDTAAKTSNAIRARLQDNARSKQQRAKTQVRTAWCVALSGLVSQAHSQLTEQPQSGCRASPQAGLLRSDGLPVQAKRSPRREVRAAAVAGQKRRKLTGPDADDDAGRDSASDQVLSGSQGSATPSGSEASLQTEADAVPRQVLSASVAVVVTGCVQCRQATSWARIAVTRAPVSSSLFTFTQRGKFARLKFGAPGTRWMQSSAARLVSCHIAI